MKLNYLRSLAVTSVLLLGAATASAHDFEVNGIFYNKNGDGTTVSVTYKGNYSSSYDEYSGAVTIPASVTYSGKTYSVTSIGNFAFDGCNGLKAVEIPNSVTSIGSDAFDGCSGLTSVEIPNSVTTIGGAAFRGCSGLTAVEIPNSVTTIGGSAFEYCSGLKAVEIPNSVTSIGKYAFYDCSGLTAVEIPNSVTSIGSYAFEYCSGLKAVEIPNSVTSIGEFAFARCSGLNTIKVQSGNQTYDSRDNCNALIQTATNTLLTGCKSTLIPNSVTSIGGAAFRGCSGLTAVEIPNSVTSIGSYAFEYCSGLTAVKIPNSVTSIGGSAFYGCSGLTSIEIPNSVTTIGGSAFYGCSGLTSVSIGNSVTSIGSYAFSGCSGLTSVTSFNTTPPYANDTFYNVPSECVLYVPDESIEAYRTATGWSRFTNIKALPAGVEGVNADAVTVRGENGVIRIEGAEGAKVEVHNAAGVCIYCGTATEITVPQRGLYVVKVAGRATKIVL